MKHICLFEDQHSLTLSVLTYAKPGYCLRLGIDRLFDKVNRYFEEAILSLHCRDYFKSTVQSLFKTLHVNQLNLASPCLFINSRVVMTQELANILLSTPPSESTLYIQNDHVVAIYLTTEHLEPMKYALELVPSSQDLIQLFREICRLRSISQAVFLSNLWDIVTLTPKFITYDFEFYNNPGVIKGDIKPYSAIYNEQNVYIGEGVTVEDFVVIDARKGPVYIEPHCTVRAHSRIEGPVFIGAYSQILGGSVKESSIGPVCKISGEVSNSNFQGFSNKAHHGFIGHSYVGEWVNFGAGTTTSNLKNNYGSIKLLLGADKIDSKQQFLGSFFGDFVRTGINSSFTCGSVIHFGSSVFDVEIHDRYVPPFSFGKMGQYERYDLDAFLKSVSQAFSRRDVTLSDIHKSLYSTLFHHYS